MFGPPHWNSSLSEYLEGEFCKESSLVLGLGGAESETDGRPGDQTDADLVIELSHVELHLLAVEGMVLGVLAQRSHTVQTASHAEGLEYFHRAPLGGAPVHHLEGEEGGGKLEGNLIVWFIEFTFPVFIR